jgi:hypothetical protein
MMRVIQYPLASPGRRWFRGGPAERLVPGYDQDQSESSE